MCITKDAVRGVDKMTVEKYQKNLLGNIEDLAWQLKEKTHETKLVRRTYILKDNGKERSSGIPALEDKIV